MQSGVYMISQKARWILEILLSIWLKGFMFPGKIYQTNTCRDFFFQFGDLIYCKKAKTVTAKKKGILEKKSINCFD